MESQFTNEVLVNQHNPKIQMRNNISTTKYHWYSFIPLFLLEQYMKFSNIFYLANACLTFIPGAAVVSPITTLLPVLGVLLVALIREIIEDIGRYRSDKLSNNQVYQVIRDKNVLDMKSSELYQGDIIVLRNRQEVPADCLLMLSSDLSHQANITTASLDGESNLKQRNCVLALETTKDIKKDIQIIKSIQSKILTTRPSNSMVVFNGKYDEDQFFSMNNIFLRGVRVMNTEYCFAAIIFTSKETRIMMNRIKTKMKSSKLEQRLNRSILFVISLLIILVLAFSIAGTFTYENSVRDYPTMFSLEYTNAGIRFGQRFVQALIVCAFLMPISLFITLEITRVIESMIVEADKNMRITGVRKVIAEGKKIADSQYFADAPAQLSVQVKNSISVENLAEVDCIFSDKTGTLTKNLMTFKSYTNSQGEHISYDSKQQDISCLFVFALSNTVIPYGEEFQGESADEVAFVQFAAAQKLKLVSRSADIVEYEYENHVIRYRMLEKIPFSSLRKKMSIILQELSDSETYYTPKTIARLPGKPFIITKGADSFIFPLCNENKFQSAVSQNCDAYSEEGLRTLAFGVRSFDNMEWINQWKAIQQLDENDENYIAHCKIAEQDIDFVAISAIEDELQDDLKVTLEQLIQAGIKVWMLTGDKTQTAINIAKSSNLSNKENHFIYFTQMEVKDDTEEKAQLEQMVDISNKYIKSHANEQVYNQILEMYKKHALLGKKIKNIDKTQQLNSLLKLTIVLDTTIYNKLVKHKMMRHFFFATYFADSVVCCRLSPQEKAMIAKEFQEYFPNYVQIGIGDGANDTFLIQAAHIGIGVAGKEGMHACNSADIAIPQFSFLKRLIFVHGRHNHFRNAKMIDYCIYKNSLISFINLMFQFYTQFTFQIITEQFILMLYNTLITFVPIFIFSLFEKDVYDRMIENSPKALTKFGGRYFPNFKTLIKEFIISLYQSIIIFFVVQYCYQNGIISVAQNSNLYGTQTTVMQCCVAVATFRLLLSQKLWNWVVVVFSIIFSYFVVYCIFGFGLILNSFGIGMIAQVDTFYSSFSYTMLVFVISIFCLIPEFIYNCIMELYNPSYEQLMMGAVQSINCRNEVV